MPEIFPTHELEVMDTRTYGDRRDLKQHLICTGTSYTGLPCLLH